MKKLVFILSLIFLISLSGCTQEIEVRFEGNGVSVNSIIIEEGEAISNFQRPIRPNYEFEGWYLDASFNLPVPERLTPQEDITLYAKWTRLYNVNFNTDSGSSIATIISRENSNFNLSQISNPTKANHVFDGWYLDEAFTRFAPSDITINDDVTIYAKWLRILNVSFNTNGGSNLGSLSLNENSRLSITDITIPSKTNHQFDGWFLDEELTILVPSVITIEDNITLHSKWIRLNRIVFNTNQGSSIETVTLEANTSFNLDQIENPEKAYHRFEGWYFDAIFTLPAPSVLTPSDNVTLFAKWIETYNTITFVTNQGSSIDPLKIDEEEPLDLSLIQIPTKDQHNFEGWYLDVELTIPAPEDEILNEDLTLFARWSLKQFTISFMSNGGNNIETIKQDYGSTVTAPSAPIRPGYSFKGWYTNQELTQPYTFTTMAAIDLTLHAKWEIEIYTITYTLNGGNLSSNNPSRYTIENQTINLINPTKSNTTFGGWYDNPNFNGNPITQITSGLHGNLRLYARWLTPFDKIYIHFSQNGRSISSGTQGTGYEINLGPVRTAFQSRQRSSLSLSMRVYSNGEISLNGFYVYSDNSSSQLFINFNYGQMQRNSRIFFYDYDILRSNDVINRLIGSAYSTNAQLYSFGWRISLTNNPSSPLPGSIFGHQDVANALADLILARTEIYFRENNLPPIR